MKPQALNDWQELSALYEQADALEDADLDIWLTEVRVQGHPLLGQLEQMLDAREQVKLYGFLDAPPALRLEAEPLAHEWREDSRVCAYRLLRRLKPDLVFATGGFVALPVALAARAAGVPLVVHEQTSVPGLANRIAGRLARRIAITVPMTGAELPAARVTR